MCLIQHAHVVILCALVYSGQRSGGAVAHLSYMRHPLWGSPCAKYETREIKRFRWARPLYKVLCPSDHFNSLIHVPQFQRFYRVLRNVFFGILIQRSNDIG